MIMIYKMIWNITYEQIYVYKQKPKNLVPECTNKGIIWMARKQGTAYCYLYPILLTWFNFNPNMDK